MLADDLEVRAIVGVRDCGIDELLWVCNSIPFEPEVPNTLLASTDSQMKTISPVICYP